MSDFLKIESESSAMLFLWIYAEDRLFLLVLGDRRASKKNKNTSDDCKSQRKKDNNVCD